MAPDSDEFFRISRLPPYPLGEVARVVHEARAKGVDIIDLSQVNPSLGPPAEGIDKLVQSCLQPHNHRYSSSRGITRLREAAAKWYDARFGVTLDPESEIVATMGAKEAVSHLLLAICSPGDNVLVPTPGYPVHTSGVFIAGASSVAVPLFGSYSAAEAEDYVVREDSEGFFERLSVSYHRTWPRPKVMILSFPHNPTGATVTEGFFKKLVDFARAHEIVLVHDFAYADLCFDDYRAPSILAVEGAKDVAVECYSLSKGFGMAGWRVGFCVGNRKLVRALAKIKSYLDFGIFQPLQIAAATVLVSALDSGGRAPRENSEVYQSRRDVLVQGLRRCGFELHQPRATVFVWARLPESVRSEGSLAFSHRLLKEAAVAASPGIGFDILADDYMRFAMVEEERRLREAIRNIERMLQR